MSGQFVFDHGGFPPPEETEDRSGLSDAEQCRTHFTFGAQRADRPRPVCERPLFDLSKLASLRRRYFDVAGTKRLVIKNPFGLARVDMLKAMFPQALFVFALRAPWPTIRSATLKGNGAYIVPTERGARRKTPRCDLRALSPGWPYQRSDGSRRHLLAESRGKRLFFN